MLLGFLFGLCMRLLLVAEGQGGGQQLSAVMSIAFLCVVPFGIGALTVSRLPPHGITWGQMLFAPWPPMLACLAATLILGWEGAICIILGSPLFLVLSSVGGVLVGFLRRRLPGLGSQVILTVVLLAPALSLPLESRLAASRQVETVETEIRIHAPLETVWRNIIRVPPIEPSERHASWFHRIGFPQPIEATLSHEGIGGVRHASFEGRLVFVETIYEWEERQSLAFSIHADPSTIPPTTLDEHVTIGGPYFDVLAGRYFIERQGPDDMLLHLTSDHRLSTHFNFYARFWTRLIMRDIQQNILQVIKARCERKS
jgi:hypothetical protein